MPPSRDTIIYFSIEKNTLTDALIAVSTMVNNVLVLNAIVKTLLVVANSSFLKYSHKSSTTTIDSSNRGGDGCRCRGGHYNREAVVVAVEQTEEGDGGDHDGQDKDLAKRKHLLYSLK